MGLVKQFIRGIKDALSNVFGFITRKPKKKRRRLQPQREQEIIEVPVSWGVEGAPRTGKEFADSMPRVKYKRRIPGLKKINRIMAGLWLFMNFVFSQFLLGSIGSQAQWVFIFFLGNCYFILKYLWGSRKDEHEKKSA